MGANIEGRGSGHRARTIGYILDVLHGYQESLWREAAKEALLQGASLVTFLGQSFLRGAATDVPASNKVFDLAFCPWIDSYLMSGGTMGTYISKAEYAECLRPFKSRPIVSIGPCGEGIRAVVIENRSGIRAMAEHLAKVHGKRRIAYVSGPESSSEAEERLAGYKEGLRAAGLGFDPALVFIGNFWYSGGEAAVREFLDARKLSVDALMAANDYMALGALRELVKRGYSVPADIAICGYDDILEAECENPALSTVRQPLARQSREAVRLLASGEGSGAAAMLETSVVLRKSCGCKSASIGLARGLALAAGKGGAASVGALLAEGGVSERYNDAARKELESLAASCFDGAASGTFEAFSRDAEAAIYKASAAKEGWELESWQDRLSILRRIALARFPEGRSVGELESTIGALRILAGSLEANRLKLRKAKDAEYSESLGLALKAVGQAESLEELGGILRDQAKAINLKSFYFAVKSDIAPGCGPTLRPEAEFVVYTALRDGADVLGKEGFRRYPAKDFLPRELLPQRPFNFISMPISFGLDFYGVAVYEPGPEEGSIYTRITDQISGSVQSTLLIQAGRAAEKFVEAKTERIVSLARPISVSVVEVSEAARNEAAKVESLGESARRTRDDIAEAEAAISRMAERAATIKEIAAVIEDISETISLLGLNAAIEAARAGHMGRGFNVIATEIRKLAESTHANVERIGSTLAELVSESRSSVAAAKRSSAAFSSLDAELGDVMSTLTDISTRMSSLSAASQALIDTM
jgi:hypothetical protein